MRTLHIIKNLNDRRSQATICSFPDGEDKAVLLMQDAVYEQVQMNPIKVYVCQEDLYARKIDNGLQQVSYDDIARMVIEFDRTIVW